MSIFKYHPIPRLLDVSTSGTNTLAHALGAMAHHSTNDPPPTHSTTTTTTNKTITAPKPTTTATTPTATTPTTTIPTPPHQVALISRLATLPEDQWIHEINEDDWKAVQTMVVTGTVGLIHCPQLLHQGGYYDNLMANCLSILLLNTISILISTYLSHPLTHHLHPSLPLPLNSGCLGTI